MAGSVPFHKSIKSAHVMCDWLRNNNKQMQEEKPENTTDGRV